MPGVGPRLQCAHGAGQSAATGAPSLNWPAGQTAAYSSTSAQTTGITGSGSGQNVNAGVDTLVWVTVSTAAWITVGPTKNLAAVKQGAGSLYLAAGTPALVYVAAGQDIAAIEDSAPGNLSAIPAFSQAA